MLNDLKKSTLSLKTFTVLFLLLAQSLVCLSLLLLCYLMTLQTFQVLL